MALFNLADHRMISILHPAVSLFAALYDFNLPGFWNEFIEIKLNLAQGISSIQNLRLAGEAVIGVFLVFSAGAGFIGFQETGRQCGLCFHAAADHPGQSACFLF